MNRRVVTITIASLLAVLGTAGVFGYVSQADSRALAGQQAVSVVIADSRIPAGTTAHDAEAAGLIRTDRLPATSVPQDALSSIGADLDALVASGDIMAGMVVLRPMFVPVADFTSGLDIPDGKIAVTVPVDAPQRVGGAIEAGSKVAVFDTFNVLEGQQVPTPAGDRLQEQHEYNKATRLLLAGVEVRSVQSVAEVSAKTDQATEDQQRSTAMALVTFVVTQAEAEKLIHAQQTGTLYLALLGTKSDVAPSAGVDNRSIFGS